VKHWRNFPRVRALPSTRACLEAVQAAATLPFREGLNRERALFAELVNTAEAKALRYAFFAERQAAKVPDLGIATTPYAISSVAIIGGGTMGTGIAMACADAGIPVKLLELDQAAAARAMVESPASTKLPQSVARLISSPCGNV